MTHEPQPHMFTIERIFEMAWLESVVALSSTLQAGGIRQQANVASIYLSSEAAQLALYKNADSRIAWMHSIMMLSPSMRFGAIQSGSKNIQSLLLTEQDRQALETLVHKSNET